VYSCLSHVRRDGPTPAPPPAAAFGMMMRCAGCCCGGVMEAELGESAREDEGGCGGETSRNVATMCRIQRRGATSTAVVAGAGLGQCLPPPHSVSSAQAPSPPSPPPSKHAPRSHSECAREAARTPSMRTRARRTGKRRQRGRGSCSST
jgi:hypothetical protein